MTAHTYPRAIPLGDRALAIEFGDTVDAALNARVLALDAALAKTPPKGVVEAVPTYRSLLIHFDPLIADPEAIAATALDLAGRLSITETRARRWRIPVVYGGAFGIDLEATAERHAITPAELIRRHSAPVYRVYMIGFMPGFAYLGGLDPRLATPRRDVPRLKTPAGTISIGGVQAAVASVEAPSGWHLLGRTPVRAFMAARDPAFLLGPGDEVVFHQVPAESWDALDRAAEAGAPVAELVAA